MAAYLVGASLREIAFKILQGGKKRVFLGYK
jgi:hypothetical protein